jgi:hypothetical protein
MLYAVIGVTCILIGSSILYYSYKTAQPYEVEWKAFEEKLNKTSIPDEIELLLKNSPPPSYFGFNKTATERLIGACFIIFGSSSIFYSIRNIK